MSKFVDFKYQKRSIFASPMDTENFTVEFMCNNPTDKRTIPNQMLLKLGQLLSPDTPDSGKNNTGFFLIRSTKLFNVSSIKPKYDSVCFQIETETKSSSF